jgi:hypothetical protein
MKATILIVITVFLFACSTKEPSVSKLLDNHIKLTIDNPKTYESVETRAAELSDLFDSPEISGQFVNVDNVAARIFYILDDIHEYFQSDMPDSITEQIVEIKRIFNGNEKFSFEILDFYVDKVSGLSFESIALPNSISSNRRQLFLENKAQYESASIRLKTEYSRLYSIIQDKLGIADYTDLVSTIESAELLMHKYRVEENGSRRLKGGLFLLKDLKVIRSMPI